MNYETLLKMVKNMNKNKGDKCLICHFPITDKQKQIKLKCNHYYHFKCVKKNTKYINFKCWYCKAITRSKRCIICKKRHYFSDKFCIDHYSVDKCPVLMKSGKRKGEKCNKINCRLHKKINLNKTKIKCLTILKSGKRKGESCNRFNCKLHKNNIIGCQVIIKSGKRKGEICNRTNCKYHKNKEIVI